MPDAHAFVSWSTAGVAGAAFLLGCRHGLDWDHVAAITDLSAASERTVVPDAVAAEESSPIRGAVAAEERSAVPDGIVASAGSTRLSSPRLALWYCVGHGSVIVLLGVLVAVLGLTLPPAIDRVFESVVGATLLFLGGFVLWQLGRDRSGYRYAGRVRLAVHALRRAWARAHRRGAGPAEPLEDLSRRSAFAVGVLHGTGAETPTQVVLFGSATLAGSKAAAAAVLVAFVAGMIASDMAIALSWLAGLARARRAPAAQIALGAVTGLSSVAIGTLFLLGRSAALPAILGG